jgi:hypothetical protein
MNLPDNSESGSSGLFLTGSQHHEPFSSAFNLGFLREFPAILLFR